MHQQHINAARINTTADTTVSMQDDSDELQEVIEVQILPQVSFQYFGLIDYDRPMRRFFIANVYKIILCITTRFIWFFESEYVTDFC